MWWDCVHEADTVAEAQMLVAHARADLEAAVDAGEVPEAYFAVLMAFRLRNQPRMLLRIMLLSRN